MRTLWTGVIAGAVLGAWLSMAGAAQQPRLPPLVQVRPIAPPGTGLPAEADSSSVTRFSFIAYGDTRGLRDGTALQPDHSVLVDGMLARIAALAATPFPVRFVLQSGDAVLNGTAGAQWNLSFSPVIERLTRDANLPYFLAAGNHDVTSGPAGDPLRALGLHNMLAAMSKLIPPEGSPRRLNGYATYAVRLRQSLRDRDRFQHRVGPDAARVGDGTARAARSVALPAPGRVFPPPAVFVRSSRRRVAGPGGGSDGAGGRAGAGR